MTVRAISRNLPITAYNCEICCFPRLFAKFLRGGSGLLMDRIKIFCILFRTSNARWTNWMYKQKQCIITFPNMVSEQAKIACLFYRKHKPVVDCRFYYSFWHDILQYFVQEIYYCEIRGKNLKFFASYIRLTDRKQ